MGFSIVDGEKTVPILVERESFSGIRRIARCACGRYMFGMPEKTRGY